MYSVRRLLEHAVLAQLRAWIVSTHLCWDTKANMCVGVENKFTECDHLFVK